MSRYVAAAIILAALLDTPAGAQQSAPSGVRLLARAGAYQANAPGTWAPPRGDFAYRRYAWLRSGQPIRWSSARFSANRTPPAKNATSGRSPCCQNAMHVAASQWRDGTRVPVPLALQHQRR
jgi:hypothetical protein